MATKNSGNGFQQPRFFKVIMVPIQEGLRIPPRFMRLYGHLLGERVVLNVPPGDSWPMELLPTEDGTWLKKGWLAFAENYAVDYGYFLVFRYDGNSQFHVIIFDRSAVEVKYPSQRDKNHPMNDRTGKVQKQEVEFETHSEEEEEDNDISVEILNEQPAPSRLVKKRGRPPGTKKTTVSDEAAPSVPVKRRGRPPGTKKTISREPAPSLPVKKRGRQPGTKKIQKPANPGAQKQTMEEDDISFSRANRSIVRRICRNHVNDPFRMTFALGFVRDKLPKGSRFDIMFRVEGSMKSWPVKCDMYSDRASCKQGWKRFVQDNGLMVGDVCVFELIRYTPLTFKTIIYRNS